MRKFFGVEINRELIFVIVILVIIAALASYKNFISDKWIPTEELTGTWAGHAELTGLNKESEEEETPVIPFDLQIVIQPDGSVTGKIGNADLINGHIKKNRTWFDRLFGIKTDYVVLADLKNPIVAEDLKTERQIRFPFNLTDGKFEDGILKTRGWEAFYPLSVEITMTRQEE